MYRVLLCIFFLLIACSFLSAQCVDRTDIEQLITDMSGSDKEKAKKAISELEALGVMVVEPLIESMSSDNSELCKNLAIVLGRIGDAKAVSPLINFLGHSNKDVRVYAANALWRIGEPSVIPLVSALGSTEYDIKLNAIKILGRIGDKRATRPLIGLIGDDDETIRASVVNSLGLIGDLGTIDILYNSMVNDNEFVGQYAVEALMHMGKPAVDFLIEGLGSDNSGVRIKSASALGRIGDTRAVEPLIDMLWDKNELVRAYAANALGFIGDKRAFEILFIKMSDEDPKVRAYATDALIRLGDFGLDLLITRLNDQDENVRKNAAVILGRTGNKKALKPLRETFFKEENPSVRAYIISALGLLGDTSSLDILCEALGDENQLVRAYAVGAMARIGKPAVETLLACLQSDNETVRAGAAEALGLIREDSAIIPLIEALSFEDDSENEKVEEALVRMGSSAVESLVSEMPKIGRAHV